MGVDPISLGVEAAAAPEIAPAIAGGAAKGAETAGALAPAEASAAAATGAGSGSLDALAAGLTPSGASSVLGEGGAAALGAGAGGVGDVLAGGSPLGQGGIGSDAAGSLAGSALPPGATSTASIAPVSAPSGASGAAGLAGPTGISDGSFNAIDAAAGQAGVNGAPAALKGGIGSDIMSALKSVGPSLGVGAIGTVLAPQLSKLINKVPQQDALGTLQSQEAALAASQQAYGSALQQPLLTGVLPPQQQQVVDNAVNDAIASTKARYANLGLSGSTMEADAISQITSQKLAMQGQLESQMAALGQGAVSQASNAMGLQDQIYNQLMQTQVSQDNNLQNAIARFAGAAAGASTGKGVNVQLGGTSNA